MKNQTRRSEGYAMLGVLVLVSLGLVVTAGMLDSAATNTKTRALVKTRAQYYYEVEETLNKVVAWMQANSKNIVGAFTAENFDSHFDLGDPTLGVNEGEHFGVHTMVKIKGTNDSVMLSNNDFFGTAAFPGTKNVDTNSSFNAIEAFKNADLGEANARVVLVWARETDGNFEPVFRVDVVTDNNPDRGVHSFSYIYTTLSASAGSVGFYGRDYLTLKTPNNDCYSYRYSYNPSTGTWNKGAPRSNCPVASDGPINISSKVYGTAKTLTDGGVSLNPPGGNVSGVICEGGACHSHTLPNLKSWGEYCPTSNGNLQVSQDQTLSTAGCWTDVVINNKRVLTLTDYDNPYYFKSITHSGNHAQLSFGSIPPGKKVRVYVEQVAMNSAGHINGNKLINGNNAPHQVEIYYLGHGQLDLEGNTDMNAVIYAPYAKVDIAGNFNFYGSIHAAQFYVTGNARINHDETDATMSALNDMKFALKKASQRYR